MVNLSHKVLRASGKGMAIKYRDLPEWTSVRQGNRVNATLLHGVKVSNVLYGSQKCSYICYIFALVSRMNIADSHVDASLRRISHRGLNGNTSKS